MKEDYPFEEIEKNIQSYWDINKSFESSENSNNKKYYVFPCSPTQVASFIWVMSEITQLVT